MAAAAPIAGSDEAPLPVHRPRVLCVDEQAGALANLKQHLGQRYFVDLCSQIPEALRLLSSPKPYAAVIADNNLPGGGTFFLSRARQAAPDTVRLLVTGPHEVSATIAALNDGHAFRVINKPLAPGQLLNALQAAMDQHELINSERELLEQTLRGAVHAMAELVGFTDAAAHGCAARIRRLSLELAERLRVATRWPLELAALLSQIGSVSLPSEVVRKMHQGDELTADEAEMVARLPEVTERLMANIPRLEAVRDILRLSRRKGSSREVETRRSDASWPTIELSARILRLATDYDHLECQGLAANLIVQELRSKAASEDLRLHDALAKARCVPVGQQELRALPLAKLAVGMVFADDVRTHTGQLLISRGYVVSDAFIERVRNFRPGLVREPVRMVLEPAPLPENF